MSEFVRDLLRSADGDAMVDAAKQILIGAEYVPGRTIHPRFSEWFTEELTPSLGDSRYAKALLDVAVGEIDFGAKIDEAEKLEASWEM